MHNELATLTAESMACVNSAWSSMEPDDLSLIACSLMDLSLPKRYEEAGYLPTAAINTPLNISISTCLACLSKSAIESAEYPGMLIRKIANLAIPEAWESVPNDDLLGILKFLPETVSVAKEIELLYHIRISWYSQMRRIFWRSASKCSERSLTSCRETGRSNLAGALVLKEQELVDFEDVAFVGDAYTLAKQLKQSGDGAALESAIKAWSRKEEPDFVAAAYIAAPNDLRFCVEESPGMQSCIENLPRGLSSDLDASIDAYLAGLLESIPEIAEVYGVKRNPHPHQQHRQLRRAAMLHPLLMLRRTPCFCAAGKTVLFGLSMPSQTYSEEALEVIALLLGVLSELRYANSIFRNTISAFIVEVFLFLVDEGRLSNGIPKQLETLAVCVLKSIPTCTKDDLERHILGLLPKLIDANKHNGTLLFPLQDVHDKLK
ncbi:hypothetical protein FGB62_47g02 [Gracilaria domingensis]|nr:hypothetical protein FGB62_47g02 [Gracilaria domingensis]